MRGRGETMRFRLYKRLCFFLSRSFSAGTSQTGKPISMRKYLKRLCLWRGGATFMNEKYNRPWTWKSRIPPFYANFEMLIRIFSKTGNMYGVDVYWNSIATYIIGAYGYNLFHLRWPVRVSSHGLYTLESSKSNNWEMVRDRKMGVNRNLIEFNLFIYCKTHKNCIYNMIMYR